MKQKTAQILNKIRRFLTPVNVFCLAASLGAIVVLLCFFFSRGELLERYFFYDTRDTGMDFFHSIEYVKGRTPYSLFRTLYPPLANLVFYVFLRFIPDSVTQNWPPDFFESVYIRGTNLDLRTYQAPMLIFLVFVILMFLIAMLFLTSFLKELGPLNANFVAVCMLLSPGMLHAVDRGNIILLVIVSLFFFQYFRNSSNALLRELSLLALAFAAGIKLYPAFFGVLLLRDKQFKRAARAVLYGIASVILPALLFKDGLSGLSIWLSVTMERAGPIIGVPPTVGTGFENILVRLSGYLEKFFSIQIDSGWFVGAGFCVAGLLLLASLLMKKEWQAQLCISLAITLFSSQYAYVFSLFLLPLIQFIISEKTINKSNVFPFTLLVLINIHLPLFYTRDVHYPNYIFYHCFALAAILWCCVMVVKNLIACVKRREPLLKKKAKKN